MSPDKRGSFCYGECVQSKIPIMAFRLDAAGIGPRVTAIFVALFLMTLVSAGYESGELGDMAAIFESPPEVVDVTAHSARVHAVTNIDVVCSVAYGETREYGRLATDSDMDASGHEDHGPLLTGLKPNTEYHLTFGGIGPDGTVYRYSDMTFRTKPAPVGAPAKPSGQDLALLANGARVVGTSSNFGGAGNSETWGGNQAIDGDASTQWSSDGDGNDAWIEIELAAETRVTGLGFWSRTMGSSAEVHAFRVVSDGGEVRGPFRLEDASTVHYFETDLTATRLRFEVTESSGGNTGAVEIEVYGTQAQ